MFNISLLITIRFHFVGIISSFLSFTPSSNYHLIIIIYLSHLASSDGYSSTSNAFIFSLINKEGLAPFKSMVKEPSYAIIRDSSYGPTFGRGCDILITNNANSNTDHMSRTYFGRSYSVPSGVKNKHTILAGTYLFTPDEVEVFYLG